MKRMYLLLLAAILLASATGCAGKPAENTKSTKLLGYWSFDEGKGESLKNSVTGTSSHVSYVFNKQNQKLLYKASSDPLWKKAGVKSGSLLFDGYSTYVENSGFTYAGDEMTISCWVAPRAFEYGDEQKLSAFVSMCDKSQKEGFDFGVYRHGTWGFQFGVKSDLLSDWLEVTDTDHPLPLYEWSNVAVTYQSRTATVTLYLNGEKVDEKSFPDYAGMPVSASDRKLTIGKTTDNVKIAGVFDANIFNGMKDEMKIYGRALSAAEIQAEYSSILKLNGVKQPTLDYGTIASDPGVLADDRYRPQYHAIPASGWMNEPHAPIYYNGEYHLFYQCNPFGPFWHQICWGHWVSTDMVHWKNVQPALMAEADDLAPDGIWSGSATYDKDGKPVLFFTAGNDSASPNQRVGMATAVDVLDKMLTQWKKYATPVAVQSQGQGEFGQFRDPFVWKDSTQNKWYMLVGSGTGTNNGGTALAYTSTDMIHWEYHGSLYVSDYNSYKFLGQQWELPVLVPVQSQDGKIKKYLFAVSPAGSGADVEVYYWLGQFDPNTMKFTPDSPEPKRIDYGNSVFTGPSSFVDPKTGRTIMFTIAQGRNRNSWEDYYSGWAHTAGMPVSLYLDGKTGELREEPIAEIANNRVKTLVNVQDKSLDEANAALTDVQGDLLEIKATLQCTAGDKFGIKVRNNPSDAESTLIYYRNSKGQLTLDRSNSSMDKTGMDNSYAPLTLSGGTIQLHIFLDRSLLEIYADNKLSISSRIYPSLADSMGVRLFADGSVTVKNLEVYQMGTIYTDSEAKPYFAGN